jgi:F-type H+-transporting ATPase subunit gamma
MASLNDIKRRIQSVKNTQKITRAMKMVAAAKLRRAQESIEMARPYALQMRSLVSNLASRTELDLHPLLHPGKPDKPINLIVVTSDRGLCGAFNSNIVNTSLQRIREDFAERSVVATVVGKKGVELLRRRDVDIADSHTGVLDGSLMEAGRNIVDGFSQPFAAGEYGEVYCLYNAFKSAISQQVTLERLLPFEPAEVPEGELAVDYVYEPSQAAVFEALLQRHLTIQMHRILNESAASEHGARMTAMDSATSNAGDMIERLTLQYNRARQDAITTELIEVVSGAAAL